MQMCMIFPFQLRELNLICKQARDGLKVTVSH